MSEETQPSSGDKELSELVKSETLGQKHEELEFDEKKKYYQLREKWFPRLAWFIVAIVFINYVFVSSQWYGAVR